MTRILIAGIGNIFLGDDGFGVAVAQRLAQRKHPDGVRVVDFGIRSFDLVYALLDGYDVTIFIDTTTRRGQPGTVYTIEPDLNEIDTEPIEVEAHAMNPVRVLRMVKAMGGNPGRILLIGCEPETLGPEEGALGLSAPVEAAVERTIGLVESLVAKLLDETPARVGAAG
jgi:hydrogenase maturation protease